MTSTSTPPPPPQQAAVVATPPAPAAPAAAPATTTTTTTTATTTTAASTAPAPAPAANTSPASMRSATSTPATKRRPYEDPTDGERYQLYTHSRAHPELKQKDLVSWFATKFGKEINQSTVSRALKRYRDNPPGDPEQEGRARSKRGGGGAGATGGGQAKRRRTGGNSAPALGAALAEAGETGPGGVEEEAARADEQVQRENQQGIIGRGRPDGTKTEAADESHVSSTAQTLPYARQHHHHHHSLPPQTSATLVHAIPPIPLAPGQHITAQGYPATGHHQISQPAPMANMSSHHTQPHHIQHGPILTQDIDSDSDSDIPDAPMPSFVNQPTQTDDSKEIQIAQITKQWESVLLRSCLETNPSATRIPPTTNGVSAADAGDQSGILSREALITYLIGRNDMIRNLQERVATLERDNAKLRRRNATKSAVISKLTAPSTEGVRP